MPLWVQHLVVLLLVAGSVGYVGWQAFQSLQGRKSRIGSCCAKGCSSEPKPGPSERIVFLPSELLTSSKRAAERAQR